MENKTKVALLAVLTLTAFAFGRYSAPTKVVEVERKSEKSKTETERNKHRETETKEVTRPDGTKEKTTKVVEDTETERKTDTAKNSEKSKETVRGSKTLSLSLLAGANIPNVSSQVIGGHVSTQLLGPITIGVWGLSDRTAGFSLGLNF